MRRDAPGPPVALWVMSGYSLGFGLGFRQGRSKSTLLVERTVGMQKNQADIEPARAAQAGAEPGQLEDKIQGLLASLSDLSAHKRHVARVALVALGSAALPGLKTALASSDWHTRWEVAKALGEIGSPDGAPLLAHMLLDEDTSVRWAAINSLVRIGPPAVRPVLVLLTQEFHSARVREGVYHVLRELKNRGKLTDAETHVFRALQG